MKINKSRNRAIKTRNGKYYFYIRDHLGNNRIVADQSGNEEQSTQYYPFGMVLLETNRDKQPFKFGGKELDMMNGLNLCDFVARGYDPATGRFLTIDPLATKYPWISPYAYCLNNPVNAIDPFGMDIYFMNEEGRMTLAKKMDDEYDQIVATRKIGIMYILLGKIMLYGNDGGVLIQAEKRIAELLQRRYMYISGRFDFAGV
jgi:RHS repeat-associated protein